jgi:hypothetical protein
MKKLLLSKSFPLFGLSIVADIIAVSYFIDKQFNIVICLLLLALCLDVLGIVILQISKKSQK